MFRLTPFANTLVRVNITALDLLTALRNSVSRFGSGRRRCRRRRHSRKAARCLARVGSLGVALRRRGGFAHVAGLEYMFNPDTSIPLASRVLAMRLVSRNGSVTDLLPSPERTLVIGMADFTKRGGDGYVFPQQPLPVGAAGTGRLRLWLITRGGPAAQDLTPLFFTDALRSFLAVRSFYDPLSDASLGACFCPAHDWSLAAQPPWATATDCANVSFPLLGVTPCRILTVLLTPHPHCVNHAHAELRGLPRYDAGVPGRRGSVPVAGTDLVCPHQGPELRRLLGPGRLQR